MQHLVIKPTLACTAGCPICACRRQLHKSLRKEKWLSFEDWERILNEAKSLGGWHLTISGGEPTLYKRLPELIRIGKRQGWMVRVNSNGSLINKEYAEELLQAGLDVVDISLYSSLPNVHDTMRRSKGLWQKATSAIRVLAGLSKQYPGFKVMSQTILCHENYAELAELLELHYRLGSSGILVSYLEGDFGKKHLFTKQEIQYFRNHVIPKTINICQNLDPYMRDAAVFNVKQIFSEDVLSASDWAQGIYWTLAKIAFSG